MVPNPAVKPPTTIKVDQAGIMKKIRKRRAGMPDQKANDVPATNRKKESHSFAKYILSATALTKRTSLIRASIQWSPFEAPHS